MTLAALYIFGVNTCLYHLLQHLVEVRWSTRLKCRPVDLYIVCALVCLHNFVQPLGEVSRCTHPKHRLDRLRYVRWNGHLTIRSAAGSDNSGVTVRLQVAENSDVVFTVVGYPSDVRETLLGPEGVLAGLKPGGVIVDMTTSDPSLAQEISQLAAEVCT